jgi:hypothetical protein
LQAAAYRDLPEIHVSNFVNSILVKYCFQSGLVLFFAMVIQLCNLPSFVPHGSNLVGSYAFQRYNLHFLRFCWVSVERFVRWCIFAFLFQIFIALLNSNLGNLIPVPTLASFYTGVSSALT